MDNVNDTQVDAGKLFAMIGFRDYKIEVLSERIIQLEQVLKDQSTSKEAKPLKTEPIESVSIDKNK